MKKNPRVPMILVIGLAAIGLAAAGLARGRGAAAEKTRAADRWLLLLYDTSDSGDLWDPLLDFAAEAYAHENLDVLVLQDGYTTPAMIWQIGPNHEMTPLKYLGEIDMTDPASLEYFLNFARRKFPDRRTILCFYDHGAGCWGACIDETNNPQDEVSTALLPLAGIRTALEKTKAVDMICFTAPCLMGSLEAAYELRHVCPVLVGSENLSGYIFWRGGIDLICRTLKTDPAVAMSDLARAIVALASTNGPAYTGFDRSYTLAAVRGDRLDDAVSAIRELSTALLARRAASFPWIDQAVPNVRIYAAEYADLIDLLDKIRERCSDPELGGLLQRAADSVRGAILAEGHGSKLSGSNGLNVYFPVFPEYPFTPFYGNSGIAFARDAGWFDFLREYCASRYLSFLYPIRRSLIKTNGLFPPPEKAPRRRIDPSAPEANHENR